MTAKRKKTITKVNSQLSPKITQGNIRIKKLLFVPDSKVKISENALLKMT